MTSLLDRAKSRARDVNQQYGEDRPLKGYLQAMSVYGASCAALVGAGLVAGKRLPERVGLGDLALVSVATHKLSRMLAKDPVTAPLRAPFTEHKGSSGDAEEKEEVVAEGHTAHAVGELLTCPFCLAQWVATAFLGGLVLAPKQTRLVAGVFSAVAGSDFLQLAYAAGQKVSE